MWRVRAFVVAVEIAEAGVEHDHERQAVLPREVEKPELYTLELARVAVLTGRPYVDEFRTGLADAAT